MASNAATCPSRNASCAWLANTRWQALPEHDSRNANMKHRASSPARHTVTSPKSTCASAPGSLACGTNPASPPARARSSAAISARRRCTYLATYEYDTRAPCSSHSRSKTRRAVCRCLRGASRSSRSISSITPRTPSITAAARSGVLRSGGTGEAIAWRTVRRCTSYLRASARTGIWLRCQSKRIAANSSTLLGPIPAPPEAEEHPIRPTIHPGIPAVPQPPGVSPRRPAAVGPNQSATPPPRPPLVGPAQRRTVGPLQSATARQSAGPEAWHRQGDPRCMSVHVAGGYGAVMPPLSRRSSRPLYLQISDDLRTQILQQQLRPGERLASEHSLMERY